jgi:hypothetical protein
LNSVKCRFTLSANAWPATAVPKTAVASTMAKPGNLVILLSEHLAQRHFRPIRLIIGEVDNTPRRIIPVVIAEYYG